MKKLFSLILMLSLACGCLLCVLADDVPLFSSLTYLTEEDAAARLAYYCKTTQKAALSKIDDAKKKVSSGIFSTLRERMSPAYIYMHIDVGEGNLVEMGAIVIVSRKNGKLEFSQVVGAYSRPVNTALHWNPVDDVTAKITERTKLTLTVTGIAESNSLRSQRQILSETYQLTEKNSLGEGDIVKGYLAMFDYFEEMTGITLRDYPRVAIELQNPVGMTESAKQLLFKAFAAPDRNGIKAIESTMQAYFDTLNRETGENQLADCVFVIDKVNISGNTISFKISGYLGGQAYILSDCKVQKDGENWKQVMMKTEPGEKTNPMIGQKSS